MGEIKDEHNYIRFFFFLSSAHRKRLCPPHRLGRGWSRGGKDPSKMKRFPLDFSFSDFIYSFIVIINIAHEFIFKKLQIFLRLPFFFFQFSLTLQLIRIKMICIDVYCFSCIKRSEYAMNHVFLLIIELVSLFEPLRPLQCVLFKENETKYKSNELSFCVRFGGHEVALD